MSKFNFRRDCYDLVVKSIEDNFATFLLGPWRTGKTVCLRQLKEEFSNSEYVNFKHIRQSDDKFVVFDNIKEVMRNDEKRIFLLDEVTHTEYAESLIAEVADEFSNCNNLNTKVIFAGSQSVALRAWAARSFGGSAGYIHVDFLTYHEFLRYKNITEPSKETYIQFIYEVADFYKFKSLENYLIGCIEQTNISNANTSNMIFDNDTDYIANNIDTLISICCMTLFNMSRYFRYPFHNNYDIILNKIYRAFFDNYDLLKSKDEDVLRQGFIFLKQCGLIEFTPMIGNMKEIPDIFTKLCSYDRFHVKDNLFKTFYITVKHPMFYMQILKDILKENMTDELPYFLFDNYRREKV